MRRADYTPCILSIRSAAAGRALRPLGREAAEIAAEGREEAGDEVDDHLDARHRAGQGREQDADDLDQEAVELAKAIQKNFAELLG